MSISKYLPLLNIVTILYLLITFTTSQQTIGCGQTVEGIRTRNQVISIQFTSTASYSEVYLEGCLSNHDITLEAVNSDGITIANEQFNHGVPQSECAHRSAGDVTIPHSVANGDLYTFLIKGGGRRQRNRTGFYSVTLFCTNSPNFPPITNVGIDAPPSSTTTAPAPTTSTTSSTSSTEPVIGSIECGQTVTGNRDPEQEISLIFRSTARYEEVYLEGCLSTHDIWLEIQNLHRITIADVDDQFNHGVPQNECGHVFAGDITIPFTVSNGDLFRFIVKGYRNQAGFYSVTLFCDQQNV